MFRFMLGLFTGVVFGLNCPKLARKGSKFLRQLADRLDHVVLEEERLRLAH
ncbi:MAG: hypothetical protein ACE5IQ_07910 [Candidatus Methylomirabilales bacterium]